MATHQVTIRRCFFESAFRGAAKRLRKALILRGIQPDMRWSSGNLEIAVNGDMVYSYKEEKLLPADSVLINRVRAKVWETRTF